jgi:chromosome partitioning protein
MTICISFISQKGGVGKSTLARALAREANDQKLVVKVADLDTQQGTIVNWHRRRLDLNYQPIGSVESFKTAEQALQNISSYDLLIIDGPARASKATLDIARQSNLVIQPTGASMDDLEPAILLFHELFKAGIPKSKLHFALSRIGTDSEFEACKAYLVQTGYGVLAGCLFEKPAYRQAQNIGLSITETSYQSLNKRADELIQSIVDAIKSE